MGGTAAGQNLSSRPAGNAAGNGSERGEAEEMMSKKILVLAVLLVGGLFTYNYVTTGELTLVPSFTLSETQQELRSLERRMDRAVKELSQAGRSAGLAGIDTSQQAEVALIDLKQIAKELKVLAKKVDSEKDRARIDEHLIRIGRLTGSR
jgi:hypothetical protein